MARSFILLFLLCFISYANGQRLTLLSPYDGATQVQKYPIFTWQFSGLSTSDAIEYTIQVAEYNSSIGKQSSISKNLIYSKTFTNNSPFQIFYYPTTAPELINCEQYVWRILASYTIYSTEEPIQPPLTYNYTSPVFKFTTTSCSISPTELESSSKLYIEPKKQIDHFVHLVSDSLYVKYNEVYNNDQVKYKIYTSDTLLVDSSYTLIHHGLNYLSIGLDGIGIESSTISTPKIYMLELKTSKGDIYRTKFERQ